MFSSKQAERRGFQGSENTLYTMMTHTCHYTAVQTHRMYTTKSEPYSKLWTLRDYVCHCSLIITNEPLWWGR